MSEATDRHWPRALPELANAAFLVFLWYAPDTLDLAWFRAGVLSLLLEFFVIHASGFMAVLMHDPDTSARTRMLQVGGLGLGYLGFVALFALGYQAWWMVGSFAWLTLAKLAAIHAAGRPSETRRKFAIIGWACGVVVYFIAVLASVFLPLPMLGATAAVRDAAGFTGSGVWEAEPHRALAGAALYFALMAVQRPWLARAAAA